MISLGLALLSPALAASVESIDGHTALRLGSGEVWGRSEPYLPVAVNIANASGLSSEQIEAAVVEALLAWQASTGSAFTFDVWVGTDPAQFVPSQTFDGLTTVHFSSVSADPPLGASRAGNTALWYDDATNEILEADVVLNDVDFVLTTDPESTTYDQEGFFGKTLLLSDVLTHELGHALGLSHSAVQNATMFPGAWTDQEHLACDDAIALREIYAPTRHGEVTGSIVIGGEGGVPGLHVVAISLSTREPVLGTFTDAEGGFSLAGLEPGEYLVLAEPYVGPADALPAYLAASLDNPCPEGAPERGLLTDGGTPRVLHVEDGVAIDVGPWVVQCGDGADAPSPLEGSSPDIPRPIEVGPDGRIALLQQVEPGPEGTWYALDGISGSLSLDLLSYSLFSPIRVQAELTDASGAPVDAIELHPLVEGVGDTPSLWDTRLEATDLPEGDYRLYLEASRLPGHLYPGGDPWLDATPFVLLLGGTNVGSPASSASACDTGTSAVGDYTSPGGEPLRRPEPEPETTGRACATGGPVTGWWLALLVLFGVRARTVRRA